MDKPIRYESIQEPLDDEERELMNPDNWDWDNPVELVVAENLVISLPIEVTPDEYGLLDEVARAEGMNPHDYIKRAALAAARANDPRAQASVSSASAQRG